MDHTKTQEYTLTATETSTQINIYTMTQTETDTATQTVSETYTDFVTRTELSTIIQPTTYTSVYISTDIIDNVSFFLTNALRKYPHVIPYRPRRSRTLSLRR